MSATPRRTLRDRIQAARRWLADHAHARISGVSPAPAKPPGPPPTRLRRVLKWVGRAVIVVIVLLVIARMVLPLVLPSIIERAAASSGFACSYERLDLSLLAGEVRLVNLSLTEKSGGESIASVGYAEVDIVPLELLRNRLHARRIELSGVDVLIDREKDGQLAILRQIGGAGATVGATLTAAVAAPPGAAEPATAEKPEGRGASSSMAIILDRVTIDHLRVHLRDASVTPAVDAHLELDALVSDIDTSGDPRPRPGRVDLLLTCPPFLDSLRVSGTVRTHDRDSIAALEVALDRLHAGPAAGYLAPLGVRAQAESISAGLTFTARTHASLDDPGGIAGDLAIDGLHATADGAEAAAIDHIGVHMRSVSSRRVEVERVEVSGLRGAAERLPDGAIRAAGLEILSVPGDAVVAPAAPVALAAAEPGPSRIALAHVDLSDLRVAFRDGAVSPTADIALALRAGSIDNIVLDDAMPGMVGSIALRLAAHGIAERIEVTGTATPTGPAEGIDLGLYVDGIALRAIAPYLAQAGIEPTLRSGAFGLRLHATARDAKDGAIIVDAAVRDIAFADGDQLAGVDAVRVSGATIDTARARVEVGEVAIDRPRIQARRDAAGIVRALGLALRPAQSDPDRASATPVSATASVAQPSSPSPATARAPVSVAASAPAPRAHFTRIALADASARFVDEAVSPTATIALQGAGFEILDVLADLAPGAAPPAPGRIRAWVDVPGIIERLEATGGLIASPTAPSLDLRITGRGVEPRALDPYLAAIGLRRELAGGELEIDMAAGAKIAADGSLVARAALEKLRLADAGGERILIEGARAHGVKLASDGSRIDVERVELERAHIAATIDGSGAPGALGFRVVAPAPVTRAPVPALAAARRAAPPSTAVAPMLTLAALHVGDVAIDLSDASGPRLVETPLRLGADAGPIGIDASGRAAPTDGPLHILLSIPGALEALRVDGTVALGPGGGRAALEVAASGISLERLRDALALAGVEPALAAGGMRFSVAADALVRADAVTASARVEGLAFTDGGRELVGVDAVRVSGVRVAPGRLDVGSIEVVKPRIAAWREADGSLLAGGIRISPTTPTSTAAPLPEKASGPRAATASAAPALASTISSTPTPTSVPVVATSTAAPPRVIALGKILVTDARAAFFDAIAFPGSPEPVSMSARMELGAIVLGGAAKSASFTASIDVPGALDRLSIAGTVNASPLAERADLQVVVDGLRAGRLSAFLPAGVQSQLVTGTARAGIHVAAGAAAEGGRSGDLLLYDIDFRESLAKRTHFHIDTIHIAAPRLDPVGGHVTVTAVAVTGVEAHVRRTKDGALEMLGLRIEAPTATAVVAAAPAIAPAAPVAPGQAPASRVARAGLARVKRAKLPLIELDGLSVGVREISIDDESRHDEQLISISDLRLRNVARWRVLGPDPSSSTPFDLHLETALLPLARGVTVTARLAPFALDPDFAVTATAVGLRGAALSRIAPGLDAMIDGHEFVDGRFALASDVVIAAHRHDALDFGFLQRHFGVDLDLHGFDVRDGAGKQLLGLSDLHVDVARIDTVTGDVHVRDVSIQRPSGDVWKDREGLHVAGLILRVPTATASVTGTAGAARPPAAAPSGPQLVPVSNDAGATPESAVAAPAPAKAPEIRVDRASLTDIAFTFEDRTLTPPLVVPLDEADIDVRGFTTRALVERRSVRISALLHGGPVRLPVHEEEHLIPVLGSVLSKLGQATHITKKEPRYELRPLFREISVRGEMAIAPRLFGSIEMNVEGLELSGFTGLAKEKGIKLEDGTVDVQATAQFSPSGALALRTHTDITGLDVKEEKGGPISSVLGLGAPLDAIVFALRDETGDISIPFNKNFPPEGVSGGAIAGALVSTLGVLVGDALKNVGVRAFTEVVDVGRDVLEIVPGVDKLPFFSADAVTVTPCVVRFEPGDSCGIERQLAGLDALVKDYNKDELVVLTVRHTVGAADLAHARLSANPGPTDRRDVISDLSARRLDLQRRRADLVAEARAAYAAGLIAHGDAAVTATANVDRELVTVGKALDSVYELERDGAERLGERRARAACLDLANSRIAVVEDALVARGIPRSDRVRVVRPRIDDAPPAGGGTVTVSLTRKKRKGMSEDE